MNNMDFVSTLQRELLFTEQNYILKTLLIQPQNPYVRISNKLFFKRWLRFFEHKKRSYQRSQITNENGGLVLCDDKAQGWFAM